MTPVEESAVADLDDDDAVDLSFAGPEPIAAAPWLWRVTDVATAYLPLIVMAVLAAATWWLVRTAPSAETRRGEVRPGHTADYVMTNFKVQRFAADGTLRTQLEGAELRHYADDDTLEIDAARIRAVDAKGAVMLASARRAVSNGDGSDIQLHGDAHVVRPALGNQEAIDFRSEFIEALHDVEQVRSPVPVVVSQGGNVVHAAGMDYDNLARVVQLKGPTSASFAARRNPARP